MVKGKEMVDKVFWLYGWSICHLEL